MQRNNKGLIWWLTNSGPFAIQFINNENCGRIINVGRLSGQSSEFDFNKHERRITFIGTTGRTRNIQEHQKVAKSAFNDLWDAIATKHLQMPMTPNLNSRISILPS